LRSSSVIRADPLAPAEDARKYACVRTLGIDLAAQNAGTAACAIEWDDGRAVVGTPELGGKRDGLDWLVELARGADATGIDAPFGFPDTAVRALSAWADGDRWTDASTLELRFRITDRFVQEQTGRWPLSSSSDLIAITAWRCAALLDRLGVRSRTGDDGVYEVYPGAALTCWRFNRVGYKRSQDARAALLEELEQPWLDLDAAREVCIASDDALDSVLAALVARAAALGRTLSQSGDTATVAREGWIHLPEQESFKTLAQV
jgi:predicted nuclease with RNAse H fold